LIARCRSALERRGPGCDVLALAYAPNPPERAWLLARQAELRTHLTASDANAVATRIARLFLRFPTRQMEDATVAQVVAAYVTDLHTFPLWAIDQAILALLREPRAFVPTSSELRARTERMVRWAQVELRDITRVLDAHVLPAPDDAQRPRNLARIHAVVAQLKAQSDPLQRTRAPGDMTRTEAEANLQRLRDAPAAVMSQALREKERESLAR
jgi:hypothetical protein